MNSTKIPIFHRDLDVFTEDDSRELQALEEGWFVEFKSSLPDGNKVARTISSFANSHGGILVVGVTEKDKTRSFGTFSPMSEEQAQSVALKVREAAEANLRPCPMFHVKAFSIPGVPSTEERRWIAIARIPKGDHAPYLHGNGVIYTRKGDSSSPIPLTDLGLLERLWGERQKRREELKRRILRISEQNDSKYPRIEMVLAHEPLLVPASGEELHIDFDRFREIASQPCMAGATAVFDNFYTLDGNYVARRTQGMDVTSVLLWEFDPRRRLHFIQIPMATYELSPEHMPEGSGESDALKILRQKIFNQKTERKRILAVNLSKSFYFVSVIFFMIGELCKEFKTELNVRMTLRSRAVRQCVAVLDIPRYIKSLDESGIPFIHREGDFTCDLDDVESWTQLALDKDSPYLGRRVEISSSAVSLIALSRSIGISQKITIGTKDNEEMDFEELVVLIEKNFETFSFSCGENPDA